MKILILHTYYLCIVVVHITSTPDARCYFFHGVYDRRLPRNDRGGGGIYGGKNLGTKPRSSTIWTPERAALTRWPE